MPQQTSQIRRHASPRRGAGGATLIELLAVIIIMTMLAAAALPVIAPAMQNRQVREAARIVNGFLTGARNRAMQTGRPVGVVFERMQGLPEACVTLSYAEVPTPYAGDVLGSTVAFGPRITVNGIQYPTIAGFPSNDTGWANMIRSGDLIKFNYIGHSFQLLGAFDISNTMVPPVPVPLDANGYFNLTHTPSSTLVWTFVCVTSNDPSANNVTGGNPKFQISRAPIRMAAGSVQLPGATVIDLTCSGFDNQGLLYDNSTGSPAPLSPWVSSQTFQPLPTPLPSGASAFGPGLSDTSSVTLTFGTSGAVDRVWCWQFASNYVLAYAGSNPTCTSLRPTQAIHLMVGQREFLPLPAAPPAISDPNANGFKPYLNWQDVGNFWVTINPQSGLVTTTEALQVPATSWSGNGYGTYTDLVWSRKLAREAISMGGR